MRARADAAGIFLDIDGVLAAIRPRPEEAFVPEEVKRLLERLVRRYRLVAAVSGRSLADACTMVDTPGVVVVGNHGMEMTGPGGNEDWSGPDDGLRVAAAASALRADPRLARGSLRLEQKGLSVSLHYRGAPDQEQSRRLALEAARDTAARYGLVLLPGRAVVDLRPPGPDKGMAVRRLVEREGLTAAVHVGDDRTDIDAFRALGELRDRGLITASVAVVSSEAPDELAAAADFSIAFAEVPALLHHLLDGTVAASGSSSD